MPKRRKVSALCKERTGARGSPPFPLQERPHFDMARERGLSIPWGFDMEGGARVWGVQGGETVAGEGGALSFAHPAAVCGRRYNDPVLGQDHLHDVLPLAALPSLVQEPRPGFGNSTHERYPGCGFVISSTAIGLLAPVYDDRIRCRCTGKERDQESGLDYFGARYYSSVIGRFSSPDWSKSPEAVPYAKLDNPQTLNLYSYAGNNPLSALDEDGHVWEWLQKLGNLFEGNGWHTNQEVADAHRGYLLEHARDQNAVDQINHSSDKDVNQAYRCVRSPSCYAAAMTAIGAVGANTNATSQNQMQKQVEKGQAPKPVDRVDKGLGPFEKDHIDFKGGDALNKDGSWKHGGRALTNEESEWVTKNGWNLPK